jgi:hypothetical protein
MDQDPVSATPSTTLVFSFRPFFLVPGFFKPIRYSKMTTSARSTDENSYVQNGRHKQRPTHSSPGKKKKIAYSVLLVAVDDILHACKALKDTDLPMSLHTFQSGVMVLRSWTKTPVIHCHRLCLVWIEVFHRLHLQFCVYSGSGSSSGSDFEKFPESGPKSGSGSRPYLAQFYK